MRRKPKKTRPDARAPAQRRSDELHRPLLGRAQAHAAAAAFSERWWLSEPPGAW